MFFLLLSPTPYFPCDCVLRWRNSLELQSHVLFTIHDVFSFCTLHKPQSRLRWRYLINLMREFSTLYTFQWLVKMHPTHKIYSHTSDNRWRWAQACESWYFFSLHDKNRISSCDERERKSRETHTRSFTDFFQHVAAACQIHFFHTLAAISFLEIEDSHSQVDISFLLQHKL